MLEAWVPAILVITLSGCLHMGSLAGKKVRVEVQVAQHVNRDSAVAVDVLYVYDDELLKTLLAKPASAWFAEREQFRRDHEGAKAYELWQWEWVPGQSVGMKRLPLRPGARAGIVFAGYHAPGEHRARFDPHRGLAIRLGEEEMSVSTLR